MKKITLILLTLLSCNKKSTQAVIIDDKFQNILTEYVHNNTYRGAQKIIEDNGDKIKIASASSYHIYFDKKNKDTILYIKLLPHLSEFYPRIIKNEINSNKKVKADGFFLFNKKPVILFDSLNYSKGVINKQNLIKKIPDSLKVFNSGRITARHIKSDTKIFKLSEGVFKNINAEN